MLLFKCKVFWTLEIHTHRFLNPHTFEFSISVFLGFRNWILLCLNPSGAVFWRQSQSMHNTEDTELTSFKLYCYLTLFFEVLEEEKETLSFYILIRNFNRLLCSPLSLTDFVFPFLILVKQTCTTR